MFGTGWISGQVGSAQRPRDCRKQKVVLSGLMCSLLRYERARHAINKYVVQTPHTCILLKLCLRDKATSGMLRRYNGTSLSIIQVETPEGLR